MIAQSIFELRRRNKEKCKFLSIKKGVTRSVLLNKPAILNYCKYAKKYCL